MWYFNRRIHRHTVSLHITSVPLGNFSPIEPILSDTREATGKRHIMSNSITREASDGVHTLSDGRRLNHSNAYCYCTVFLLLTELFLCARGVVRKTTDQDPFDQISFSPGYIHSWPYTKESLVKGSS